MQNIKYMGSMKLEELLLFRNPTISVSVGGVSR